MEDVGCVMGDVGCLFELDYKINIPNPHRLSIFRDLTFDIRYLTFHIQHSTFHIRHYFVTSGSVYPILFFDGGKTEKLT